MPRCRKLTSVALIFAASQVALLNPGRAQPVVATGAAADEAAIARSRSNAADTLTSEPATVPNSALFQSGLVSFRLGVRYQYVYADGLHSGHGPADSSYIQSITPSLVLDADKRWTLTYAPSFVAYSNPAFRDTVAQYVNGQGKWVQPSWSGMIAQQYSKTDAPLIESGRQSGQQTATTRASVDWFAANFSYGLRADQTLNFIQGMTDTFSWSVQPHVDYRIAAPLTLGVGAAAGYALVYHASDLESVRPMGHARWQLTRRTALDASVGYDEWRFVSGTHRRIVGTYYSLGVNWQPFTETTVIGSAEQSNSAAPFQNEVSQSKKWSLTLRQRLLRRLQLELTMDNQNTNYLVAASTLETARADRIRSYSVRLSTTFLRRGTAAVFYRRNKNASSEPGFGFSSGQVGFELGFAY